MKHLRLLLAASAACLFAVAAFAADPTGNWKWTVTAGGNGDIVTTAKFVAKDGVLTGTYSNSYGDGSISSGTVKDDDIAFKVERDYNGNKFTLQYQGKLTADAIKGSITISGMQGGGEGQKIDWNATRDTAAKP